MSRIAMRVDLDENEVLDVCRRAGVEPKVLRSYSGGRYGVDLPLPVAQTEDLPPMPVRMKPAAAPVLDTDPVEEPVVEAAPEPEAAAAVEPEPVVEAAAPAAEKKGRGRSWTPDEDEELRRLVEEAVPSKAIAASLGRGVPAVQTRMASLGLRSRFKRRAKLGKVAPAAVAQPTSVLASALMSEIAAVEARIRADEETLSLMRALVERAGGGR